MRPHPLCAGWLRGRTRHRRIEFVILGSSPDKWDARVTIDGATIRAMTAYSYFGKAAPPRGGVVAGASDESPHPAAISPTVDANSKSLETRSIVFIGTTPRL